MNAQKSLLERRTESNAEGFGPLVLLALMATDFKIVKKILKDVSFYVDATDKTRIYAEYRKNDDRVHFQSIESADFESALRIWYRTLAGDDAKPSVKEIQTMICDEQNYYGEFPEIEPRTRVAGSLTKGLEYYLANSDNCVIKVANGSWDISESPQHRFLTSSSQLKQVMPKRTKQSLVELLQPLVNLQGDNLILFAIWLTQGFSGGSHHGLLLSAERGSAKSTLTRLVNQIVDPSRATTMQLQKKIEDFQDVLADNYLCCYDNLRSIPEGHSDTLAAAITCTTVAKRVLYTTHDIAYMQLHNLVVLNGINLYPTESDLAERFLYFELKKLTSDQLQPDKEIEQLFAERRPLILGAIFELLAKASLLVNQPTSVKPTRMANAYGEMLAIAKAMGLSEQKFDSIIRANLAAMQRACASTPLVQAVAEYMDGPAFGKRKITESSTTFFRNVTTNYSGQKSALPSSAAAFSKRLKAEHDGLAAAGFSSIIDDTGPVSSTITIIRDKK